VQVAPPPLLYLPSRRVEHADDALRGNDTITAVRRTKQVDVPLAPNCIRMADDYLVAVREFKEKRLKGTMPDTRSQ
jgi:hypothetical protein